MPLIVPTANGTFAARPRVLIPERVSPDGLTLLKESLDVDEKKGLSPEDLLYCIGEYEALIVRSETKVTAAVLAAGKRLKVVARAGVGVDNVDVDAATKHGIIVVNSPVGNINAAAEHTIARMYSRACEHVALTDSRSAHGSSSQHWTRSFQPEVGQVGEE